ncbi:MAG: hypothetical protein HLUCCA11_18390 [Phormidesmis priestleyi Ana]|uniref:Uncharacterized protein n=1 Tax=Phormidesmis priestleyi Ana TaxID=1666911 RepID=A0A0P7YSB4_9CYAN|nr:MAG: hypothetical protein HLUCCA11_18390 [Phormidesmis priestleyi Ana]
MYSDNKISQLFGDQSLAYVKNRHRGGTNNEKGNTYENFYTTYKIALLSADAIEKQASIKFYSQVLSFVDDLIILYEEENRLQHHQLKNSLNVSWGSDLKSISNDFEKQEILNQSIDKASELVLVVSDQPLQQRLSAAIPAAIQAFSKVAYFPHRRTLMQVIHAVPEFYEAIKYLCAFEDPAPDKIECVAQVLLGSWSSCSKSGLSVIDILTKAQNSSPSFIRSFDGTLLLDSEVASILSNIANFQFNLSKGFLHWQYGHNIDQGTIPYCISHPNFRRFQERIKASNPKTFEEFEILL